MKKWLAFAEGDMDIEAIVMEAVRLLPEKTILLREAFEKGDMDRLREIAHSVKGSYGNLQMLEVSDPARKIDAVLQHREDMTSISELIREIEMICESLPGKYLEGEGALFQPVKSEYPKEKASGTKILIVDDEEINRSLFGEMCNAILELPFDLAENGKEALEKVDSSEYAIVLLDLNMPVMDGMEFLESVSESGKSADLKIIALSGHGFGEERDKALQAGCIDYVEKPVDLIALAEKIQKQLKS